MTHEFHATCCGDKILSPKQNFFSQQRACHTRKTVAATCPRFMTPLYVPATSPLVCVYHETSKLSFLDSCNMACNMFRGQNFVAATKHFFAIMGMSHEENCRCNVSPLHVPALCSRNISLSVCLPRSKQTIIS